MHSTTTLVRSLTLKHVKPEENKYWVRQVFIFFYNFCSKHFSPRYISVFSYLCAC
jgi:hypothetical protein